MISKDEHHDVARSDVLKAEFEINHPENFIDIARSGVRSILLRAGRSSKSQGTMSNHPGSPRRAPRPQNARSLSPALRPHVIPGVSAGLTLP